MNAFRSASLVAALAGAALLTGCNLLPEAAPERARQFVLEGRLAAAEAPAGAVRLGLRPVEVPAYLRAKAMVQRSGENEVRFVPDAYWAEPLDGAVARLLRERLAARAKVLAYPFPAQLPRDYDLTVRVLHAEGAADGVRFTAVIELLRVGDQPEIVVRKQFTASPAAWNNDPAQLARGLSAAVEALADEVVALVPAK
jgi:uncharacterized lipoprotein YmbA